MLADGTRSTSRSTGLAEQAMHPNAPDAAPKFFRSLADSGRLAHGCAPAAPSPTASARCRLPGRQASSLVRAILVRLAGDCVDTADRADRFAASVNAAR
jgi:hypothetical protein